MSKVSIERNRTCCVQKRTCSQQDQRKISPKYLAKKDLDKMAQKVICVEGL